MKYVIVSMMSLCLWLLLVVLVVPSQAAEVSPDLYIRTYSPGKSIKTKARSVEQPVKQRMPVEQYTGAGSGSGSTAESPHTAQIPSVNNPTRKQLLQIPKQVLPEMGAWLNRGYSIASQTVGQWYSSTLTYISQTFDTQYQKMVSPIMPTVKKTTPVGKPITKVPTLQKVAGMMSRFQDSPYSPTIPQAMKAVYSWDRMWNPIYNPEHYLQCTTFVAMVYNLNGVSLQGKVSGDARSWISYTNTFDVYENGNSTERPQVMDIAVWATNGANHVGVISMVTDKKITIINGNATQLSYTYDYSVDENGVVQITGDTDWVPSHWMRLR